ncbi:MAG: rhodanese-like domain-containing protein [Saprospiraceae bacterium]|nr:rhodanese-like domain-containing protein [Saprospiraceae bacterium]
MDITVQELKAKLDNGDDFIFIDVRELHEYEEFNLGAILIPLGEIMQGIETYSDKKDSEVVLHCRSGNRSGMAKTLFEQNGFKNVRNLTGGVLAWVQAFP